MDTHDVAPGHYPDMKNAFYHKARAVSKSRLDRWEAASPMHYWEDYLNPDHVDKPKTPALITGDACHGAILEPNTFERNYCWAPKGAPNRPSTTQLTAKNPAEATLAQIKFWGEFDTEHKGKLFLKPDQLEIALRCRDAVHRHPEASKLLTGGRAEQSYFAKDPVTGLLCKVRPDYERLDYGMIVDVKSTICANEAEFGRAAENYRYHVQGPFYCDVVQWHYGGAAIEHFVFVAFEKEPPWAVGVYYMTPDDFEDGEIEYRANLDSLARHIEADFWPDEGMTPRGLVRPYWAKGNRRRRDADFAARRR